MDLAVNTCFLSASGSPEGALKAVAEAGFTHLHWCHHWRTDFLYGPAELKQCAEWLRAFGLRLLDVHGSAGQEKCWYSPVEYQRQAGVELVVNRVIMLRELEGTGVRLLDTRKTLPGFRHLEKYAVRVAGGVNHRMNLWEMLMVKDNHIDAAGSITRAVASLREHFHPCPPIEVECRGAAEVREAVACRPARILLDNMGSAELRNVLPLIPPEIEAEISGGVTLENIRELALSSRERPADFISVGRLTHSAPSADFSMRMERRTS